MRKWGGLTTLGFSGAHLVHDLTTGLFAALLAFIKLDLGIDYLEAGLLLSAFTITSGFSQILGGWLGDHYPRPRVIAMGLAGVGLTAIAISQSSQFYVLLGLLVLMGLFSGAYHPSAIAFLSGRYETRQRGKALAVHMVGGSTGFSLAPIVGALIAALIGWRFAFLALSLPVLVEALLFILKYWRRPVTSDGPSGAGSQPAPDGVSTKVSLWEAIRPILTVVGIVVLVQLVAGTASAFLPLYLVDAHGVAAKPATMLLGVSRAGGIIGSLVSGWLSDRWNPKRVMLLAIGITGPVLIAMTHLPSGAGLTALFALFGMGMYMRGAAMQVFLMNSVPPQKRATVFGIYFGLGMEGMSLVQPAAGYFMDLHGISVVYRTVAYITTGVALVAPLVLRAWRRTTGSG